MAHTSDTGELPARINAALIPDAAKALVALKRRTGLQGVDVVNRALQIYDFLDEEIRAGKQVGFLSDDGTMQSIKFL